MMLGRKACTSSLRNDPSFHQMLSKVHSLVKSALEPITDSNKFRILEDIITPFAHIPYEKQLTIKKSIVASHVKELTTGLSKNKPSVLPISPSPVVDHYRSKDEFNVQMGVDGNEKTFGFFTGGFRDDLVLAVSPMGLRNIKPEHKKVLQVFEDFVRKSPMPPCYRLNDGGYWRQIIIRSNQKNEIMVIVVVHPQNRSPEELSEERERLIEHFHTHEVKLHSLYHHLSKHVKGTEKNSLLTLIYGAPCLYEKLSQRTFRISPLSFFQINVKATEVLHEELAQIAEFKSTDTLLDLCCGVGGLSYSDRVRSCIGIEQNQSALGDALANCALNNVTNCFFTLGKLEERFNIVVDSLENINSLVAILNPGRSGVHPRVVDMLLENPYIKTLFFISCQPNNVFTVKNVRSLLSVKRGKKEPVKPFVLKTIKPVDLFPHTVHYEMILHFER